MFGVFLAYFGSYVHRPRMMGLSSVLAVLGTVIMFLPHYIAEPYRYDGQIIEDSDGNGDLVADTYPCAQLKAFTCSQIQID